MDCPDSSPAPAADSADFVGAADSTTAPAVSKPALVRQRVPWTNFPVWPGQSIVQPMFVEKSALPIFPHVGMAAAAPVSKPAVFLGEPWTVQPVQTHRQHLLPILPISSALPIPTLPPVSKPALFRQLFP